MTTDPDEIRRHYESLPGSGWAPGSSAAMTAAAPSNRRQITRGSRGDVVRNRGPVSSSATMSSILIPVTPGR